MTTLALNRLWSYIDSLPLSSEDRNWLAGNLNDSAVESYENDAKPYSLEEIENMIHTAEKKFMSGDFYTTEDVLRYCAEER